MTSTVPAEFAFSTLAALCAFFYATAALRLICYHRPKGARHRPVIALTACLLIALLSCRALALIVIGAHVYTVELLASACLCIALVTVRGNLAALLWRLQCLKS